MSKKVMWKGIKEDVVECYFNKARMCYNCLCCRTLTVVRHVTFVSAAFVQPCKAVFNYVMLHLVHVACLRHLIGLIKS